MSFYLDALDTVDANKAPPQSVCAAHRFGHGLIKENFSGDAKRRARLRNTTKRRKPKVRTQEGEVKERERERGGDSHESADGRHKFAGRMIAGAPATRWKGKRWGRQINS